MEKLIELWILKDSGVCMFHHTTEPNFNPNLFGSIFTAINQFGKQCSNQDIDGIILKDALLMSVFRPELGISIVGKTRNPKLQKSMKPILHEIGDKFAQKFPQDSIEQFNGFRDQFNPFTEELKEYMHMEEILLERFMSVF